MTPLPANSKPPVAPKPRAEFHPPEGTGSVVTSPDVNYSIGIRIDPGELDSSPGDTYLGLFDSRGAVLTKYLRPDHTGGAICQFAPDSKSFAIATGDGTITLIDSATQKELRKFQHGGSVRSLAFAPDGRFLATACDDGPILIWDVSH